MLQVLLLLFLQEVWAGSCRSWIVKENKIDLTYSSGKYQVKYDKAVVPMKCLEYFTKIKVSSGNTTIDECIKPNCIGFFELTCFDDPLVVTFEVRNKRRFLMTEFKVPCSNQKQIILCAVLIPLGAIVLFGFMIWVCCIKAKETNVEETKITEESQENIIWNKWFDWEEDA